MCLILFAWRSHSQHKLLVAANRDEFYARPTASAHFWHDAPHILAGRDLEQGGTWLGITSNGRFAALTNVRNLLERPAASRPVESLGIGGCLGCGSVIYSLTRCGQLLGREELLDDAESVMTAMLLVTEPPPLETCAVYQGISSPSIVTGAV